LSHGRVAVVMPAYNAAETLERTYADVPKDHVDDVILVDDASRDRTVEIARRLGLHVVVHPRNRGYGANQKTCYRTALDRGADVVVMVHPDHQYDPRVIPDLLETLRAGGLTIVASTPYMDEAMRCDRVALIQHGRILDIAEPRTIGARLGRPLLAIRSSGRVALPSGSIESRFPASAPAAPT